MSNKASATLNGLPLLLDAPITWSLTEGTQPSTSVLHMAPADATQVFNAGGPMDLVIAPAEGGKEVRISNLWCLHIDPGSNPYISNVVVADRRWFWPYSHVLLRLNKRRNIGYKRVVNNESFAVDFDRAPDVAFWRWSLDNTKRYNPTTAIKAVFSQVLDAEKNYTGSKPNIKVDDRIGQKIKTLPIENLEIDDPGDAAVQRMMSYLPEAGVTVDYDGTVVVFSRAGGDEAKIVSAMMPEIRDAGHTDLVKNSRLRPKEINVYFTRECEVVFDFVEVSSAVGQTVAQGDEPLGELRRMDNVLPISDYQLQVTEIDSKPLCQGTWITVDQAFRAWGSLPLAGTSKRIDHKLVQRSFVPHMDLWAPIQLAGDRPDLRGNLVAWIGRIAALQNHYRTTFRLNSRWMDKTLVIRPFRLATVDPQSGQRGPSRAYGDYCVLYTQRSIWRNDAQGKPLDYAINKTAYPSSGMLDDTAEPSPCIVQILDHDQGVLHLDYSGMNPLTGDTRLILPAHIELDSMPTWKPGETYRPISFDSVINENNPPRMSASFKVKVILTAVPASPNSKQQLHKITVKPTDVRHLLPSSQQVGLNEASGPAMDIRVGPDVEVARIAWNDSKSAEIEKCFGLTDGEPNLDGLVLNDSKQTRLETGGSLWQIAQARAAAVYASLVDRYEGEMTGYLNGNIHLSGWTDQITHEYGLKGDVTTKVSFPPRVPQMSIFSWLDSNTRAAILKLVRPEGQ